MHRASLNILLWVFTFLISLPALSLSAGAVPYDCDCGSAPAPVIKGCPLVNPSADPLLLKGKQISASTKEVMQLKGCIVPAADTIPGLTPMQNLAQSSSFLDFSQTSDLKSEKELLRFLSCNRDPGRYFCDFKKYYLPYAKHASETMQMPLSLFACVAFQESHFNPNLVSPKGAAGLTQFTYNGWSTGGLRETIATNITDQALEDKEAECDQKKLELDALNITSEEDQVIADKAATKFGICKRALMTMKAWRNYNNGNPTPKLMDYRRAKCPQTAFAMTGAKFYYDVYTRFSNIKGESLNDPDFMIKHDRFSTLQVMIAGYNMGINGVASLCAGLTSEKDCVKRIQEKAPKETRKYIERIGTCMKKGGETDRSAPEVCTKEVHGCEV